MRTTLIRDRRTLAAGVGVPGGATVSLHAIPALEAEFGKPVVTNLSAEIWSALIRPGSIPPVEGWGKLLANRLAA